MKIALLGFEFKSGNKGCEALCYSFIRILNNLFENDLEIHNYTYSSLGDLPKYFPNIKFFCHRLHLKNPKYIINLKKEFKLYDAVFDVTFGDGFSDIYGKKWNFTTNLAKQIAINSKTKFVLLPQTYGPFDNALLKKWSLKIIKKSTKVFSRDILSTSFVNENIKNKSVFSTIDMAFVLPYQKDLYKFNESQHVGINISSLLWDSSYAKDNKFNFTLDYKELIKKLINYFLEKNCVVHLIPHVINKSPENGKTNDYIVSKSLEEEYNNPNVICAPAFTNPIEAKSYISNMSFFIGSRMHSTIASVSSNVPTLPIAYSRKFEGLFSSLEYPHFVNGYKFNTDEAFEYIINLFNNKNILEENLVKSKTIIDKEINKFIEELKSIFEE